MIVLDASVLIAHLDGTDAHHDRATQLLRDAAGEPFGASPITVTEVLVGPARARALDRAVAALHHLGVYTIYLPGDGPARLASLRADTGRKLPDCAVLLAAEQEHAEVATFDGPLAAAARSRGLVVRDL